MSKHQKILQEKIESNLLNIAANSDDASSLNALLTEYKIKKYLTLLM
jgi:hypothetical protein